MVRVRTPLGRLPWWAVAAGNAAYWPAWTFACGYVMHRWPPATFEVDDVVTRERTFERGGRWYEERLRIRRWKDRLPEAGGMFAGGFAKRDVAGGETDVMVRFVAETRRAETMHWAVMAGTALPMVWNPWWAFPVHATVAAGSNLPCIAIQRYNRLRLQRVLGRRARVRAAGAVHRAQ
jgi:glycosyl-4,4'-diaponeurosporenoate acyltransferase